MAQRKKKTTAKSTTRKKKAVRKSATSKTKKKVTKKKASTTGAKKRKSKVAKAAAKRSATKKSTKKATKKVAKKVAKKTTKKVAAKKATKKVTKAKTTKKTTTKKATKKTKAATAASLLRADKEARIPHLAGVEVPKGEFDDFATEDLWGIYRDAANKKTDAARQKVERLRNALIERHYPLVKYIAERLLQTLPKSIELDDLISAGLFGLMDAIRGFDASRGIKFKTYCSTRVRGAILDQLRSQDWVPRLVRLKASRIERALQKLTAEYGREPTHAELAKTLEMDHGSLVTEIQASRAKTMFSLSEKWEDDDGSVEKVEVLEDKNAQDPVGEMNRRDLMGFITRALTHKERFIIEQYYQYGHTMREIGEMLALTESRVCQIHSNVMSRLKSLLGQKANVLLG